MRVIVVIIVVVGITTIIILVLRIIMEDAYGDAPPPRDILRQSFSRRNQLLLFWAI